MPAATASQTIGLYWHLLEDPSWADLTRFRAKGERIALIGTVTDGDGVPVSDACVELWQASPEPSETWDGFGRAVTDAEGNFRFITLKPGPVPGAPGANTPQAPHAAITVFARGLLIHLHTRAYFKGDRLNDQESLAREPRTGAAGDAAGPERGRARRAACVAARYPPARGRRDRVPGGLTPTAASPDRVEP